MHGVLPSFTIHQNGDPMGVQSSNPWAQSLWPRSKTASTPCSTRPQEPSSDAHRTCRWLNRAEGPLKPLKRQPWSTPKKDGWSNKHRKVQGNSASLRFFVPRVSVEDKIVWASTTPNVTTGMRTGYYTRMQLTMCLVIPQWKGTNSLNPHWLKIGPPRMI